MGGGDVARKQDPGAGQTGAFWAADLGQLQRDLGAAEHGLSDEEAARRRAAGGPNRVDIGARRLGLRLLLAQFTSPIIIILTAATMLSMAVGDITDGVIILGIILASGGLGFWQERSAGRAVDALLSRVQVKVELYRDGREVSVPVEDVVPGDLVRLRAGDIIPADCRVTDSRGLEVDQAALTGEPFPVEKKPETVAADTPIAARTGALFMGTHVVSGEGTALVVQTGRATEFAAVSQRLAGRDQVSRFRRELTRFGLLLVRVMAVLLALIFAVNLLLDRPVLDSLLFALALAVGLTPQILPAIVTVSLSVGARHMAAQRVIVKRLDAIEDFGAMTILLTDKTGTLTTGAVTLHAALGVDGQPDPEVRRLAQLNAGLQQGFSNPMDQAIMAGVAALEQRLRLAEVPYDFERKRLSVLVDEAGTPTLVTKGAVVSVLGTCTTARTPTGTVAMDSVRDDVQHRFADLSGKGFRVLALASRAMPGATTASAADEAGMTLLGLLTFQDPPKPGAAQAIQDLADLGISVRLITGDNPLAAAALAGQVGLAGVPLLGTDVDRLSDDQLADRARDTPVFAEVDPLHKERIVRALQSRGAVVGFVGDGINDAAALHSANVGISVDTAVDVAKQSAAIVLLEKDLSVVADGIRLGRRTFANTLKYIRVSASAAFGNVLSMSIASAALPFLPLLARQILLINFLSDVPYMALSTDRVDPEQVQRPRTWSIRTIRTFMLVYGSISVTLDIVTFLVLRLGFDADEQVFRTGWFIEMTVTEIVVLLVLRTNRPFFRSRVASTLLLTSGSLAAVTIAVPYTPLAGPLGLTALGWPIIAALAGITVIDVLSNEIAKRIVPPDRAATGRLLRVSPETTQGRPSTDQP